MRRPTEPKIVACRHCGAQLTFMLTAKGKMHPVSASAVVRRPDEVLQPGKYLTPNGRIVNAIDVVDGITVWRSHFQDCPGYEK
jgi:hypothetical protein